MKVERWVDVILTKLHCYLKDVNKCIECTLKAIIFKEIKISSILKFFEFFYSSDELLIILNFKTKVYFTVKNKQKLKYYSSINKLHDQLLSTISLLGK